MNLKRLAGLSIAFVLAVPFLAACGAERSTEAFCEAYNEEKDAYLAKYGGEPADGWEAIGNLVGAMSAWVPMFDRMAEHAPEEIRADVEHIRDTLKASQQNAGSAASDPLGNIAGNLMMGLMTADSWQRLGEYVEANCVTEEELAARQAAAEQAEAEAKSAEDAAKIEQAEENARYVIEILSAELSVEVDTSYLDGSTTDFEYYVEDAKTAVAEAEDALGESYYFDDPYYCDYPEETPWAYAVERVETDIEEARYAVEHFSESYYPIDSAYLDDLILQGETAVGDLARRVPDSPMVNTLADMLDETRARKDQIAELNASAQTEAEAIVAQVEEYLPTIEAVAARGDAALNC
jgi:hypothetical protein